MHLRSRRPDACARDSNQCGIDQDCWYSTYVLYECELLLASHSGDPMPQWLGSSEVDSTSI